MLSNDKTSPMTVKLVIIALLVMGYTIGLRYKVGEAGIRSFIGWEPKLNSSPAGESADEDAPSEDVEALPRFQKLFREILDAKAGKDPVYVFIDDLDRAQPDVALDIMESIRIALSERICGTLPSSPGAT